MNKKVIGILISVIMIVSIGNATGFYFNKSNDSLDHNFVDSSANILSNEKGIVAHWKFDETSGNVAEDSVGDFHGAIQGDAIWTAGRVDNALFFDGIDNYVDLPQNTIDVIGSLTQGTISFWFNFTYLLDHQEIMPIFYIGIDNEFERDSMFIIELGHNWPTNTRLYVTWIQNNWKPILCFDTGFHLIEKKWYHFALVVGPDGNTGYLNGNELVNRRYNFGHPDDQLFLDEIPVKDKFSIGYGKTNDVIGPHFLYFKGLIDDLRIYDQPLSSSEIQEFFGDNIPPSTPFINGTKSGKAGEEYEYTFVSNDIDNDDIFYYIDWGDGQYIDWNGPYNSDEEIKHTHTFSENNDYSVQAKAKDIHGAESEWGILHVSMPWIKLFGYNYIINLLLRYFYS
jgi:hypothetical protein